jgi:hypothetical protein
MNKLLSAIEASLPLIYVRSSDVLDKEILTSIIKKLHGSTALSQSNQKFSLLVMDGPYLGPRPGDKTLILIDRNNHGCPLSAFDAGVFSAPIEYQVSHLRKSLNGSKKDITNLVSALTGLELTQMLDVASLCYAKYKTITPALVCAVRHELFTSSAGVSMVQGTYKGYLPGADLQSWVDENKSSMASTIPAFWPKGLLLEGPAGTGKTAAARWVAGQFKCPLFKLDLGSVLSKWLGEAESNFAKALTIIEDQAPCVLLVDEVEKFITVDESTSSIKRILGNFLWWLQERTSNVVVLMTTNDKSKIPPELYRPGRVDKVLPIEGIPEPDLIKFLQVLNTAFRNQYKVGLTDKQINALPAEVRANPKYGSNKKYNPSAVEGLFLQTLKTLN